MSTSGGSAGAGIGYALGTLGQEIFGSDFDERALRELLGAQVEVGPSAVESLDPETKRRMMAALENLQRLGAEGGMDAQARAAQEQASNAAAVQERMQRQAIAQNAAMRGMNRGAASLAGQYAAQQGGADRARMAGVQAAGDARTRALQAMLSSGQLAGQVRGQDINAAQARDAVAQFNAAQRLRKAGMVAGAYNQKDEDEKNMWGGVGGLVGGGIGSAF